MSKREVVSVQLNEEIEAAAERIRIAHSISRSASLRVLLERGAGRTNTESKETAANALQLVATLQQHLSTWLVERGRELNWSPSAISQLPDELAVILKVK